ncbi:ABC transporter substrate-binding protein [Amycolatopsis sp. YIM 10]|uniref:ABC transporter substrate-binding protein n=1 Tax=Amycolatopsis sp. YIM 10 TaxID=2653857 RepID=UPI00129068EE|nr:ABC transporter substrate-binding protein [Amycolatopsis sp. YIM 10]QFU92502.1 Glutathione-binding protein GsiB precursor [Amycolatopsis sp. YIM 10]
MRSSRLRAAAWGAVALLAVAACGPTAQSGDSAAGATGDPVQGGTATLLTVGEPRTLDPAAMMNLAVLDAALGNALYGTLLTADPVSGAIQPSMGEMTTSDGGANWRLTLRPGLKFSDGTPLDAAAVKVNWDRIKDPKTGSAYLATAAAIESSTVIDDRTLGITLVSPNASYPSGIIIGAMNWIASPTALKTGQASVGAGPYLLDGWDRGSAVRLKRNPGYWDSPKPYLDTLTVKLVADGDQRLNTLISGGAQVALGANPKAAAKAKSAGAVVVQQQMNGGGILMLNLARAPFADPRAREAVSKAIDLDQLNLAALDGAGIPVKGLFGEQSPLHTDHQLHTYDPGRAQALFDELAAEGKPLRFTMVVEPTRASEVEAMQAQFSSYRNVTAEVRVQDAAANVQTMLSKDYDALYSGNTFVDPETSLWSFFHGSSPFNSIGLNDPDVNKGLDLGRTATELAERKRGYDLVQTRFEQLNPVVFTVRLDNVVLTSKTVGGVRLYGFGSLLVQDLWVRR